MPNPLKADPTRTTTIRRRFMAELRRRYMLLRSAIVDLVVKQDIFGLKKKRPIKPIDLLKIGDVHTTRIADVVNINTEWKGETNPNKVKRFRAWLRQKMDTTLAGDALIEKYIKEGFEKGIARAYRDAKKPIQGMEEGSFSSRSEREFLSVMSRLPITVEKVKLLSGRVFNDLEGVNNHMGAKMSRVLADGFVQHKTVFEIANDLVHEVDISIVRAMTIARTEIVRAHAEGQLHAMEQVGVEEVGAEVEWSTAGDDLVCPLCADLEGKTFKIKEAYGLIPQHPNCRCAWLPIIESDEEDDEDDEEDDNPTSNVDPNKIESLPRSDLSHILFQLNSLLSR